MLATLTCISLFLTLSTKPEQKIPEEKKEETVDLDIKSTDDLLPKPIEKAENKQPDTTLKKPEETIQEQPTGKKIIRKIIVSGNNMVPESVILSRIPYKEGELFNPSKTRTLIHNLYYDLKRFRNITVMGELAPDNQIDLYIIVEEKKKLKGVEFRGNHKVSEKNIEKKVDFSNLPAIDEEELHTFAHLIKDVYKEKNYHNAQVTPKLELDEKDIGTAVFEIKEGNKSMVKRIRFTGNEHISGKVLRNKLFTREDWILSFLDNAGSYQPERIEGDRQNIEQYYQNRGYLMAKVTDAEVKKDPETGHFDVLFHIEEGDLFKIKEVKASGNDILKDEYIVSRLPVQAGDLYSRDAIMESIKALEGLWSELGYIYTHVDPSIAPDEETKTVKIAFHTDLGKKVFLNKINIIGNQKTHDKVIRRKLLLSEGQLLTGSRIEASKHRVEALGYFDQRDGVTWRKIRLDEDHADLDLILKEVKTGNANLKVGFGGAASMSSPGTGFSIGGEITDRNLFGTGKHLTLNASWAKEEQSILFNLTDPWLFDKPISGAIDIYHRRPSYDDFRHTRAVNEQLSGGGLSAGFLISRAWETQIMFRLGVDRVSYQKKPEAKVYTVTDQVGATAEYQSVLDKLFEPGTFAWFETHLGTDKKNHPIHPSRGYKWLAISRFGLPSFDCNIGFHKFDIDAHWYTPLIGERDLVFHLRGYLGILTQLSSRTIPYRELFHVGGASNVRGFKFGQAGPRFLGDSIGGTRAFCVSAELIFPITPDFNMKGVAFYDAGAGWRNPYACDISSDYLEHNTFNFRHSVGVGLRVLQPVPVRIDWGFKLNPNKKLKETYSEVHFGMSYDF